jgi:hypothetical protein
MAFKPDLWIALAAVSSVIALACIVASVDSLGVRSLLRTRTSRIYYGTNWIYVFNGMAFVMQGCLMVFSLQSLAMSKNVIDPLLAANLEGVGLFVLLVGTLFNYVLKELAKRREEKLRPRRPSNSEQQQVDGAPSPLAHP